MEGKGNTRQGKDDRWQAEPSAEELDNLEDHKGKTLLQEHGALFLGRYMVYHHSEQLDSPSGARLGAQGQSIQVPMRW